MQPGQGTIDINAIKEAMMRRAGMPGAGQGPATPALAQVGQPTAPNAISGGIASPMGGTPTPMNPKTPTPQYSSPFSGPAGAKPGVLDEQSKNLARGLMKKLLEVF